MKNALRLAAFCLALLLLAAGCGIQTTIQEDAIKEALPGIDPAAGIGRDVDITLYFRLTDEPALVPVQRTVAVRANEYVGGAVVRQLLSGPTALFGDLERVLPKGTRLVDIYPDGGILYVVLSKEILEYEDETATREEVELTKRLSVYAVVNSLCALGEASRVQVLVDMDGTGKGSRVSPFLLGFTSEYTSSQWLDPMGFEEDMVINPALMVNLALQRLTEENYAQAYMFFAEDETGGLQKPDFAAFETDLLSLGTIDDFTVKSTDTGGETLNGKATADITWTSREDGTTRTVRNAVLALLPEGGLYKIGFYSLMEALEQSR
ncbi:MAG TPA: GerMN domain-containing protein [Feifaniaceae bacterium]|nr:GerMN domain-containing protein [Feifaniaceae bacterium]